MLATFINVQTNLVSIEDLCNNRIAHNPRTEASIRRRVARELEFSETGVGITLEDDKELNGYILVRINRLGSERGKFKKKKTGFLAVGVKTRQVEAKLPNFRSDTGRPYLKLRHLGKLRRAAGQNYTNISTHPHPSFLCIIANHSLLSVGIRYITASQPPTGPALTSEQPASKYYEYQLPQLPLTPYEAPSRKQAACPTIQQSRNSFPLLPTTKHPAALIRSCSWPALGSPKYKKVMDDGVSKSPTSRHLARHEPSEKRRRDTAPETHPLPAAKRARLENTEALQPGVDDEESEQAPNQAILQQPKPRPPRRPYAASFLKHCVDPVDLSPPPDSLNTFVSQWLESVGSDGEKRCRSDSYLDVSYDHNPVSRQLTRSAPEMAYNRDVDGFTVPPTPVSTGSRSRRHNADAGSAVSSDLTRATSNSSRSSSKSLVEGGSYRDDNLVANGIYLRAVHDPIPEHVADLVDHVGRDRDSPGPSLDEIRGDPELYALAAGAAETDTLRTSSDGHRTGTNPRVRNPVPDMLYGYNRPRAFPDQAAQLISMGETNGVANSQGLMYPFFVIEFKGDGPSGAGSLWVATNQCLGGSASCVKVAERLNQHLRDCKSDKIRPVNSAAFSVAMTASEARLHISWKHDELSYYMANVKSFLLQDPEHYLRFRKYVRNIIDWGQDKRLNEIRESLNTLLEEGRKKAFEAAKSRQPPSEGSATNESKKHKSSSSHRDSSRSDSGQGQGRVEED
ncbi:hypothetical protein SODALDRAFT_382142 [Sodiomyces alkalinus F11]|uniref:DUF7924 domain-containing protein n=1 Tax=Sodiomyces alkalinus (strain CBS 110278 / VKM F-3762 / F11) TaxID=1314773 RepID=A0A3N2PL26_SODAK|nr:hypothetical protein SODALDRAFT_382142 [Sodiomyces alkalinus F11]ROT35225.1 hypothetical protein SODALDRAFT_382142 [Sodiomyces alkalinus F11]